MSGHKRSRVSNTANEREVAQNLYQNRQPIITQEIEDRIRRMRRSIEEDSARKIEEQGRQYEQSMQQMNKLKTEELKSLKKEHERKIQAIQSEQKTRIDKLHHSIEQQRKQAAQKINNLESDMNSFRLGTEERLNSIKDYVKSRNNEIHNKMDAIDKRNQQAFNTVYQRLDKQQQEIHSTEERLNNKINRQQKDFSRFKSEINQKVDEQRTEYTGMFETLGTTIRKQRDELYQALKRQRQEITQEVEKEREERKRSIRSVQNQINHMVKTEEERRERAKNYVEDVLTIHNTINRQKWEKYVPGKIRTIDEKLSIAFNNMENGDIQAAMVMAQTVHSEIEDIQMQVDILENEFMSLYETAKKSVADLIEAIETSTNIETSLSEAYDSITVSLDVDYWSRGAIQLMRNNAESLYQELLASSVDLSTERVNEILAESELLIQETNTIVQQAICNLTSSQSRVDMAREMAEALHAQGYEIVDTAYKEDDERNSFHLKMKNIAGSEVVTIISPIENEPGDYTVSIHSFDNTFVAENVLLQRAKEMLSLLGEAGVDTNELTVIEKPAEPIRDFERIKQPDTGKIHR